MYRFRPILRPMVWGSELWALSGYPERLSVVASGPDEGLTVNELAARDGARLLGRECFELYGGSFPLLVKFLDVRDSLSIQVHPSEEIALRRHGSHGKTEMWYVVRAEEGAQLISGFARTITPEEYARRVNEGSLEDVLARHNVAAGEVFFIPPGRVHSLCKGCYVAEIQQASDITYRIYDYGRPCLDGKPRELHTEFAAEALDFSGGADYRTHYTPLRDTEVPLVDCSYFSTAILDLSAPMEKDLSALDSFVVVVCLDGSGVLSTEGAREPLSAGDCVLVPAEERALRFVPDAGGLKVLSCHL